MQRNKYLDALGLDIREYGTNFKYRPTVSGSVKQRRQRKTYGFDERETWGLDIIFAEWLYSHMMMYKETASEIIDLSFYKYTHNEKEYTQEEAIDYVIDGCKEYILSDKYTAEEQKLRLEAIEKFKDAITLFAKILPAMWW